MLIRHGGDDVIRHWMLSEAFQSGMMARCREANSRQEHINETGFARVPSASEGHGVVALRVQIS